MLPPLPAAVATEVVDTEFFYTTLQKMLNKDLTDVVEWRRWWRRVGNACFGTAKGAVGGSIIFEFVASFYRLPNFHFAAGCASTVGLVLMSFGAYAFAQVKEKNKELVGLVQNLPLTTTTTTTTPQPQPQQDNDGDEKKHQTPEAEQEATPLNV